ncbi:hypothetical protein AGMMS49944_00690 [Spirochaetia bacterium]|nr:hypothetical protein AGMMS49944_00690 [Spirochaetia bacterium]
MQFFRTIFIIMVIGCGMMLLSCVTTPVSIDSNSKKALPRLAILPFTGTNKTDGEAIALRLANNKDIRAAFTTIPRTSAIDAIMAEQKFQHSGLTDSDTISKLGKQLNADFVVAGHIQQFGEHNLVFINIVNVETFQQIAGDYRRFNKIEDIYDILSGMTKKIVNGKKRNTARMPKLAVLPFDMPTDENTEDAEVLAQILGIEIANSGKYAVLPRTSTIEAVMKEQAIQRSGITDVESIKALGRATNAEYVLAGKITKLGNKNIFFVEILNVEKASLLTGIDEEYQTITDGLQLMPELAAVLTNQITEGQREHQKNLKEWTAHAFRNDYEYFINPYIQWDNSQIGGGDEVMAIHWSFIPFTSLGFGAGVGGTSEGVTWGGINIYAGAVLPLTVNDGFNIILFGDGLLEIGYLNPRGLIAEAVTPGYDAGIAFNWSGFGIDIKYKGVWYSENHYRNSIGIGFIFNPWQWDYYKTGTWWN